MRKQDLSPRYQKQVEDQLDSPVVSGTDAEQPEPSKHDMKQEKDFQAICEDYLGLRGYMRLTAYVICAVGPCSDPVNPTVRGYFGHWFNNRRNPFILDLLILSPSGRYLMVELKTSKAYQPGQKELVAQGYGQFAYSFEQFVEILDKWEKQIERT